MIGSKPFVARGAVLTRVNEPATASTSVFPGQKFQVTNSVLFVAEAPLTCAEVGRNLTLGGRYLKYDVRGHWPLADGATFVVGTDPSKPTADNFAGALQHGSGGSILKGTVRIARNAPDHALLDMDVSTLTTGTETSGSLRGLISVLVCH